MCMCHLYVSLAFVASCLGTRRLLLSGSYFMVRPLLVSDLSVRVCVRVRWFVNLRVAALRIEDSIREHIEKP